MLISISFFGIELAARAPQRRVVGVVGVELGRRPRRWLLFGGQGRSCRGLFVGRVEVAVLEVGRSFFFVSM